jgi:hypothetical protein
MHSLVLLITEKRPTPAVIDKAMKPFCNCKEPGFHYDWYGLGGRYSGNLEPISPDEAIVGDATAPKFETRLFEMLSGLTTEGGEPITIHSTSRKGNGADACQIGNLANIGGLSCAAFITDHGQHTCPTFNFARNLAAMGVKDNRPELEIAQETRVLAAWDALVLAVLETTPPDHWLSILDCHN